MSRDEEDVILYLSRVWCDVLNVRAVGIDQSFFAVGGNSMLAIRMLAAVLTEFDSEIDLERFFAEPSIRTLSRLLDESHPGAAPGDVGRLP